MRLWCYGVRRDEPDEIVRSIRAGWNARKRACLPPTPDVIHDCGEWVTDQNACAICDHPMPPDFPVELRA